MTFAHRSFSPTDSNAVLVSSASDKQGVTNKDYASELESYRNAKDIERIMRSNRNSSL